MKTPTPDDLLYASSSPGTTTFSFDDGLGLSHEAKCIAMKEITGRLHKASGGIGWAVGEDRLPAYFTALVLGAHALPLQPEYLRYFESPVQQIHIRDLADIVRLIELVEDLAEALSDDPSISPGEVYQNTLEGHIPWNDDDLAEFGLDAVVCRSLDLLPDWVFTPAFDS